MQITGFWLHVFCPSQRFGRPSLKTRALNLRLDSSLGGGGSGKIHESLSKPRDAATDWLCRGPIPTPRRSDTGRFLTQECTYLFLADGPETGTGNCSTSASVFELGNRYGKALFKRADTAHAATSGMDQGKQKMRENLGCDQHTGIWP